MNPTKVKLILRVDTALEHPVVDALLTYHKEMSFQVSAVKSYHAEAGNLTTVQDQVSGYRPQIMIQVDTEQQTYPDILHFLKQTLPKCHLKYHMIPLAEEGSLEFE